MQKKQRQTNRAISGILEEMTIEDVRAFKPTVAVLPIGSTEPHGPHLPYGCDYFAARAISDAATRKAVSRGAKVIMLPALPIGNNVNFRAFPFALRISVRALMQVVEDIVEQLASDGIRKVVIVNGHGGNIDTLRATLREIAGKDGSPFVCMVNSGEFASDAAAKIISHPSDHGGEYETCITMALRPELVKTERLSDNPFGKLEIEDIQRAFFIRPWHLYAPASAGGECRTASVEKGRQIVDAAVEGLAEFLVKLDRAKRHPTFPYKMNA